ncbi:MAG TPA: hypothetical protein VNC61_17565 [Acidimicrobiales bacterium]|nr:hypothetical protein [Acidimicrobiales bacterium]
MPEHDEPEHDEPEREEPEREETADRLRREFGRQAPEFDLGASLAGRVTGLVRRRRRLRLVAAVAATAAVMAAVAVPLSALRSTPLGHGVTPAMTPTTPTTTPTTPTTPTTSPGPALACNTLDLSTTGSATRFTTTTSLGPVTATLAATTGGPPQGSGLSDAVVTVAEGASHFTEAVTPPAQANGDVVLSSLAPLPADAVTTPQTPNDDALCLVHFPGDAGPTLLIGLDTGYAHCCTVVRALTVSPTGLAAPVDMNTMNAPASLTTSPTDGGPLIVTADNAFAYQFTSFAFSGLPIRLLRFTGGAFVDVTKLNPDLVTTDARRWMTAFNANATNGLGLLAAWVADECVLGHAPSAYATLNGLLAGGKLVGPTAPQGAAYVAALKAFLTQHGYCRS